ncbi:hypothetical protein [Trichothermofontia sp.]
MSRPVPTGQNEIDTLTGGVGADVFVLGDRFRADDASTGLADYALITDFDPIAIAAKSTVP